MAKDKTSFVLYSDQRTLIELLSNEQAGVLLKHIFAYVNDENPICEDQLINIAFEPIKQQFKRDLVKWERTKEGRSKAGLASAEARKSNKLQQTSTNVNKVQQDSTNSTVNDNVNVNVNDINNNIVESIDYDYLLKYINDSLGRNFKIVNDKVKNKYKSLFKQGYTKSQIKEAIDNVKNNQYHKDSNYTYCTLEFFSRPETIDKYSSVTKVENNEVIQDDYYLNIMKKLNQQ